MSNYNLTTSTFILAFLLIATTVLQFISFLYLNPMMLYISMITSSFIYVTSLIRSKNALEVILLTTILLLPNPLIHSVFGTHEILTWDHKAMENVASFISTNGRVPQPFASNELLRIEYISYPITFLMWVIVSQITSLDLDLLAKSPLLNLPLYVIVVFAVLTLLKPLKGAKNVIASITTLLGVALLVSFAPSFVPFIYQSFGRTLMLLTMIMSVRTFHSKNLNMLSNTIVILLLSTAIIMSHSESAVAIIVFSFSLIPCIIISNRLSVRQVMRVLILTIIIIIIIFWLHHLWLSWIFGENLLRMIIMTFSYAVREELVEALSRYTPFDYSFADMVLLILGFASVISIVVYNLLLLIKNAIISTRSIPLTIVPLLVAGLLSFVLFAFSPYKSDISLKFLYLSAYTIALFLYENASTFKVEIKQGQHINRTNLFSFALIVLIILLISLSMSGVLVLKGATRTYTISSLTYRNGVYLQLNAISNILLNSIEELKTLLIVDDPSLPYFFVRDYIVPRIHVNIKIMPAEFHEPSYKIMQVNGILLPRFILTQSSSIGSIGNMDAFLLVSSIKSHEFSRHLSLILSARNLLLFVP